MATLIYAKFTGFGSHGRRFLVRGYSALRKTHGQNNTDRGYPLSCQWVFRLEEPTVRTTLTVATRLEHATQYWEISASRWLFSGH
jgi:hypothetical protein